MAASPASSIRVAQRAPVAWVRDGAPPPDRKVNPIVEQDFGRGFDDDDVSGVSTRLPPRVRRTLPSLVPRLDADGNETSGPRSVQLQVPLGTYLGWNVATRGFGRRGGCGFEGASSPSCAAAILAQAESSNVLRQGAPRRSHRR